MAVDIAEQHRLSAEAERLQRVARGHKRAARQHRDRAAEAARKFDALIAACTARGIPIHINTAQPNPGGHSGHSRSSQAEI